MNDLTQKIKRQVTNQEKNICKHISNKGFVSKHTNNFNTNIPIKIGKDLNGHLAKEDTQTVHKTMPRTRRQKNNGPAQLPEPFVTVD